MDLVTKLTEMFFSALPTIIVGVVLVLGAFAAVYMFKHTVRRLQFGEESRRRILQAWAEVEENMAGGDDVHLRMAIIQADAVLDMALMAKHFPGRSLNDRLNFAIHKYRGLKRVRWAHGLRNRLAHEPMMQLTQREGRGAIRAFGAALRDLGAL